MVPIWTLFENDDICRKYFPNIQGNCKFLLAILSCFWAAKTNWDSWVFNYCLYKYRIFRRCFQSKFLWWLAWLWMPCLIINSKIDFIWWNASPLKYLKSSFCAWKVLEFCHQDHWWFWKFIPGKLWPSWLSLLNF